MRMRTVLGACAALGLALLLGCDTDFDELPDLTLAAAPSVDPAVIAAGETATLTFRVSNEGFADATDVRVEVVRIGTGVIATREIDRIEEGQLSALQTITFSDVAGTHSYVIVIDPGNSVEEIDEGDNEHVLTITVGAVTG